MPGANRAGTSYPSLAHTYRFLRKSALQQPVSPTLLSITLVIAVGKILRRYITTLDAMLSDPSQRTVTSPLLSQASTTSFLALYQAFLQLT